MVQQVTRITCRGLGAYELAKFSSGAPGTRGRSLVSTSTARNRTLVPRSGRQTLPQLSLPEVRRATRSVYVSDHPDIRGSTRLRWLISTCTAATIAVVGFAFILYGSFEPGTDFWSAAGRTLIITIDPPARASAPATGGKTDRLLAADKGLTTRHVIHDTVQQQKDSRTFISIKPYVRVVARLSSADDPSGPAIPAFNPVSLFAPTSADNDRGEIAKIDVVVLDLPAGFLPAEDNQELTDADVVAIVRDQVEAIAAAGRDGDGETANSDLAASAEPAAVPANTADIPKNRIEADESVTGNQDEMRVVDVTSAVRFNDLLVRNGVQAWQAREISQVARTNSGLDRLTPGQQVRMTFAPATSPQSASTESTSASQSLGAPKPVGEEVSLLAVSIFGEGAHVLTVARTATGGYAASNNPRVPSPPGADQPQIASLYTSFYRAALAQGITPPMIMAMLRTFAYDTDFKRRVSPGDGFEAFFDIDDEAATDSANLTGAPTSPRNLLYMSLTVGGETRRFYRFQLPEGGVDYFDLQGNNAKKFLLRKPVRGTEVRFTSGFGTRLHPILKIRKMHTGVDWATATGTPIIAAGNGVIEQEGRKGGNGNYIRIRHANGYETAYSHMSRFQPGLGAGAKVTQGQVVGYVGSTGFSSGPHLHFEVMINGNFVDPMTMQVPRERQLAKKALADFQREQARIDELMGRAPVSTVVAQATNG
jgi:murein DD-endopeptidase MepM/ murein hydrolase activator NlpD